MGFLGAGLSGRCTLNCSSIVGRRRNLQFFFRFCCFCAMGSVWLSIWLGKLIQTIREALRVQLTMTIDAVLMQQSYCSKLKVRYTKLKLETWNALGNTLFFDWGTNQRMSHFQGNENKMFWAKNLRISGLLITDMLLHHSVPEGGTTATDGSLIKMTCLQ